MFLGRDNETILGGFEISRGTRDRRKNIKTFRLMSLVYVRRIMKRDNNFVITF